MMDTMGQNGLQSQDVSMYDVYISVELPRLN